MVHCASLFPCRWKTLEHQGNIETGVHGRYMQGIVQIGHLPAQIIQMVSQRVGLDGIVAHDPFINTRRIHRLAQYGRRLGIKAERSPARQHHGSTGIFFAIINNERIYFGNLHAEHLRLEHSRLVFHRHTVIGTGSPTGQFKTVGCRVVQLRPPLPVRALFPTPWLDMPSTVIHA